MPEPSPETTGAVRRDSVLAGSGDLATEISAVAHGDAHNIAVAADIQPGHSADEVAKRRLGTAFWIAAGFFLFVVLLALLAPWLPIKDPSKIVGRPKTAPNGQFWFGTDALGRDIFSRVIWGARPSLLVGFASIVLGLAIGGPIGLLAGYLRRGFEAVLMTLMDVLLSFPALLLAMAIVTFSNSKTELTVSIAVGVVAIAPIARLVRANTLVYSQREFVTAARSMGAGNIRIIVRDILPNVMPAVISFSVIAVAVAIVAEGGLSFLGLSIDAASKPTWGNMIVSGRPALETGAPWISLVPSAVLFVTVLALNLAGDRIREYTDIKGGDA